MVLRFFRSTSPRSRHTVLNTFKSSSHHRVKKILYSKGRTCGRNHRGSITCRHRGGGHKRIGRKIDFFRKKLNKKRLVQAIDYDPNRNSRLALIRYDDGEICYILSPNDIRVGRTVVAGFLSPLEVGNARPLWNLPLGRCVHNVELFPGAGGRVSRSAGTNRQLIARDGGFATIRLPSGEIRVIPQTCWATIGRVGNIEAKNRKNGKAGRVRWLGRRPVVRGSSINPVDHPHGGGEGRCSIGRKSPTNIWGNPRWE